MLEELRISSLGVIDDATVEFGPGLNVVTGETGAGKTMVVTALGLLLGSRADPALVRLGASQARVEARLDVADDGALTSRVEEVGAVLDDGVLIVGRTVSAEGRSRASAGGAAVPAGVLGSLTSQQVVVHGQSDQQRLLLPARQRECLDAFGGSDVAAAVAAYRSTYQELRSVRETLHDVVSRARERAHEADLLRHGLEEVANAEPLAGEDAALVEEEQRLAHADGLRAAAERARMALTGDESSLGESDALSLVAAARKALDDERGNDPSLAALADALADASYALADVAADISSYAIDVDDDPARLAVVSERRSVLAALTRTYGETVDDVLAWAATAALRLEELTDDDERVDRLHAQEQLLTAELAARGSRLSDLRVTAAAELARLVTAELASLAMAHSVFGVDVTASAEPGWHGMDDVGFTLATHRGAAAVPLAKGASGGELSRVMLALEVCLAGSAPPATMVFDEVDAGVGGKAAVEIGRRLAALAATSQVIVVTHLPQVAAFADHHSVVVRSSDGSVTTSGVAALDEAGRLRELSRMLAGLEDSATALAHAGELVELARRSRTR
ncbi:MAG: DNA repair protein RecN [Nocardioidaceae bacterium]